MSKSTLNVGELKRHLGNLSDDTEITFAGGLNFYRVKRWSDTEVFIEFNEPQADLSPEFKKRNPNVKVVFISTESVEWGESEVVGSMNVTVR